MTLLRFQVTIAVTQLSSRRIGLVGFRTEQSLTLCEVRWEGLRSGKSQGREKGLDRKVIRTLSLYYLGRTQTKTVSLTHWSVRPSPSIPLCLFILRSVLFTSDHERIDELPIHRNPFSQGRWPWVEGIRLYFRVTLSTKDSDNVIITVEYKSCYNNYRFYYREV